MTPSEWQAVKEQVAAGLSLVPDELAAFLTRLAAGNPIVHREVESLIRAHEANRSLFEQPFFQQANRCDDSDTAATWTGMRLGTYRLVEKIGEGGMGTVFRAVRDDGVFDRQAAVKVIGSGVARKIFLERFKNERQILARLDHPNIARLVDGGAGEDGTPYLVMELVEGVPIDSYCRTRDLSIHDRLTLFRSVCSAVQYAHQNLIVHRDLKPGNILVTQTGQPKLLDFGIAKILDPPGELQHDRTVMPAMTLDYASPEQIRGEPITTASDVYSLGVVLYVLLTGRLPFQTANRSPHEVMKTICDTEPLRPSAALSHPATTIISRPQLERLQRAVRGDVDCIVLKALRKLPAERYATVEQFSTDILRHLEGRPVTARRGTAGYTLRKFVTRHATGVATAVGIAVLLVAALAVVSMLLVRVRAAAAETRAALAQSQAVADFLERDVLAAANPEVTERNEIPVREVLEAASRRVTARFAGQPLRAAAVHRALGQAWNGVGDLPRALQETQSAIDVLRGLADPVAASERVSAINALAFYSYRREDYATARAAIGSQVADATAPRSRAEQANRLVTSALVGAIDAHQGHFKEGLAEIEAARAEAVRVFGPVEPQTLAIREMLVGNLLDAGIYPRAELELRDLVRDRESTTGKGGPDALDARENLAEMLVMEGRGAEGLSMIERLYDEEVQLFGSDDPRAVDTGLTLAAAYDNLGHQDQAEPLYKTLIAIDERRLGPESNKTLSAKHNLATLYLGVGKYERALALDQAILATYEKTDRGTTRFAIHTRRDIGRCLVGLGRWREAAAVSQRAVDDAARYLTEKDFMQSMAKSDLATSLGHLGEVDRARRLFDEAIAGLTEMLGPTHDLTRKAVAARAELEAHKGG